MQSNLITIKVLIACHNRVEKTVGCLTAVFNQEGIDTLFTLTIYLVDDGSTDNTSGIIAEKFPNVKIIQGDGTLFWNRGMNLAWANADKEGECDYFIWLNNDTFLFKAALSALLSEARNDRILCAATCSAVTGAITYGGINKTSRSLIIPNGAVQPCDFFTGNCVLVPYTVFRRIGFLNVRYHHAIGDLDYGLRAAKQNIHSYLMPCYGGTCELHEEEANFFNPAIPFAKRWKALHLSSCTCHPYQRFLFEKDYEGLLTALFHFITVHIRVAVPLLWRLKTKFVTSKQGVPL